MAAVDPSFDEVFVDLGAALIHPPTWLIENLVPPGLVFIGAPPKSSKSTVSLAIALLVAGYKCKALPVTMSKVVLGGPVMMFSYEEDAGGLKYIAEQGLKTKVKDNGGIVVCEEPSGFQLDDERGMSRLLYWLNERDPRLVILDPLRNFHSADENDSGQMSRLLSPLRHWALTHEACVMVVHHAKKLSDDRTAYDNGDLRGSSAMFGMANGVLIFTPKPNNQLLIKATFKRGASWERTIIFGAYGATQHQHEELTEQEIAVLSVVPGTAATTVDALLKKVPSFDRPSLAQILQKLERMGFLGKSTLGWRKL